jgi:hypothetical protein
MMATSKTFNGVTAAIWERVKSASEREHGTVYTEGDSGTATTNTPVGKIILEFKLDTAAQSVTYTIVKKPPFVVSTEQIWNGIQEAIQSCRSG